MPTLETGKVESGFTLLEVLAVLILIGLLTALVFPDFYRGEEKKRIQLIQELIKADLRQVRGEAMAGRAKGTLSFDDNGYYFQIGETGIRRNFDHFNILPKTGIEQVESESSAGPEAGADEAGQSGPMNAAAARRVSFNADGLCTPKQFHWKSAYFEGTMDLAEDGTVEWSYGMGNK